MSDYYVLDGKIPRQVATAREWSDEFEQGTRRVARDVIGDVTISTVFLGLNHNWGEGPPLLFETMIFGGPHDGDCFRCSTWEEAEAQHKMALALVTKE